MTKLKLFGLFLTAFFSVLIFSLFHPINGEFKTTEGTQKITTGSETPGSNHGLSLAPYGKNTAYIISSFDDVFNESANLVDVVSGKSNVASPQLCVLTDSDCSRDVELHRLISIVESSTDNGLLPSIVKKLWHLAADLGAPEQAISTLRSLERHPNEDIAALASRALDDLVRLKEKRATQVIDGVSETTSLMSNQESANITGEGLTADVDAIKNRESQNIRKIQELRTTGLNEHQPEKRRLTVKKLSRYREVEVIDALIEAAYDVDNRVRHDAVHALWIVGGDNKNNPDIRQVLSVLDRATLDSDTDVARLATKALEDLLRNDQINTLDKDLFTPNTSIDNVDGTDVSSLY